MLKELEQLLQEIAQQQGAPPPQQRPQQQRPTQQRQPPQYPAQQRPAQQRPPATLEVLDADIVYAEPVHERVVSRGQQELDTTDVTGRAAKLGAEVGRADDKMDAHLHEKFDHDLSKIDDAPSIWDTPEETAGKAKPGLAKEIAAMLRNPATIRQAVILSEVLNRPEDRW